MAQLRQDSDRFIAAGAQVIILGPENAAAFQQYWEQNAMPFIGLPDPTHSVLKRFGQEVNLFKLGRMPAQVIVDRQGIARFAHYGKNMSDIPDNADLLTIIEGLDEGRIGTGEEPHAARYLHGARRLTHHPVR